MVVLIAAGAGNPNLSIDPFAGVQTMTAYIGGVSTGDIPQGTLEYDTIFAVGALLFVMTLVMNMIAIRSCAASGRSTSDDLRPAARLPARPARRGRGARRHARRRCTAATGRDRLQNAVFLAAAPARARHGPARARRDPGVGAHPGVPAARAGSVHRGSVDGQPGRGRVPDRHPRNALRHRRRGLLIVPIGVGAAIYLEEYADRSRWWNRLIELNIQNLAGVPSIVFGILGLAFIVRGPLSLGFVAAAGSMTLALLVLPTVILAAREAIRAVPPPSARARWHSGRRRGRRRRDRCSPPRCPGS
jgi:hypothetical protein